MHTYYVLFGVIILLLSGCTSLPGPGKAEPMKAAEECAKGKHVKSEEDGHEFTTYGVSEIANYARKRQLVLTYFSQYPDIDPDYDEIGRMMWLRHSPQCHHIIGRMMWLRH